MHLQTVIQELRIVKQSGIEHIVFDQAELKQSGGRKRKISELSGPTRWQIMASSFENMAGRVPISELYSLGDCAIQLMHDAVPSNAVEIRGEKLAPDDKVR